MTDCFARAAFNFANMIRLIAVGVALSLAAPAAAGEMRLVMFDQPGCYYCQKWEQEIGPVYPATEEAKRAPLTRVGLRDDLPDGIVLDRPATLTPTFVLLEDGTEVGRLEGYPGEDFFWFLLGELFDAADTEPES